MYCWGRWGDGEMGRLNNEHILYNRILYNTLDFYLPSSSITLFHIKLCKFTFSSI
ncbi:MAG: hypothetical protein F6K23_37380 [Okeania sp. SIO2C9]|uniref:hypothetical protein n=1 Tax=Okeania sp. SIO2C9 TaxID=2607791 RepID=UPI0013BF3925|nr:hypothetical protein [Okeania sp. SIO2C9]NEQ78170.1 hypothetical protein [Okeania sp. SIO2C9]